MLDRLRAIFSARTTGDEGERLAADFLRRQRGWRIVARNWRNPRDRREEIDLIVREGEVLVLVEVKTRAAGGLVSGYHAVDRRKRKVLRRAAKAYVAALRTRPRTVRFDVVEVTLAAPGRPGAIPEVRHFENIPLFGRNWRP